MAEINWAELVEGVKADNQDAMTAMYKAFNGGIRYYPCRQLGPQELEDKVHDTFLIVLSAIKRGDLREPARLMGFVRTIVRRQVAAYIETAVHVRREQTDLEIGVTVSDKKQNPEQEAILRERTALIKQVLDTMYPRDREILTRFYLFEQSRQQICAEMGLTENQFRLYKSRSKAKFGKACRRELSPNELELIRLRKSRPEKIAA